MTVSREILVIGYGNPGRVDDGLGPAFAERVERAGLGGVRVLTDYQLQVEHASEVAESAVVVFADASTTGDAYFSFRRLLPRRAEGFSTHSMRPEAVVAFARDVFGWDGEAFVLGLRGVDFNRFGEELSEIGLAALAEAEAVVVGALREGRLSGAVTAGPTDCTAAPPSEGSTQCKITNA